MLYETQSGFDIRVAVLIIWLAILFLMTFIMWYSYYINIIG